MKLFKTIDEKFEEIGFKKVEEGEHGAEFRRFNKEFDYVHVIYLGRKQDGMHLCQSYDYNLIDENNKGNVGVGLTMYEMKLCLKKMRKMGLKMKRR